MPKAAEGFPRPLPESGVGLGFTPELIILPGFEFYDKSPGLWERGEPLGLGDETFGPADGFRGGGGNP